MSGEKWTTSLVEPMLKPTCRRLYCVIRPDGSPLTKDDLPPADTARWVPGRKAEVVAAVRGGLLTLEEVCDRYKLTLEEFLSWQTSIDRNGLAGLRVTCIHQYRSTEKFSSPRKAVARHPGGRL
jgi:hypothetical protein